MRALILAAFLVGVFGTAAELLLVGHTEGFWQWLPLLLMGLSIVPLAIFWVTHAAFPLRSFQGMMVFLMLSGVIGLFLHYDGKVEFKKESDPSLSGWPLFRDAMKSAVPPALAPAAMIQFGLLGLAYTCRHPVFSPKAKLGSEQK
jgi:hypothetical protein